MTYKHPLGERRKLTTGARFDHAQTRVDTENRSSAIGELADPQEGCMNRRQVLGGVGLFAAAVTTVEQASSQTPAGGVNRAVVSAASDCVGKGQVCLSHCHVLLAAGDKSLGECAKMANEVVAVCGALLSVAAQSAPSLSRLAGVALEVCRRCESECRKFAHAPCKDCAAACAACALEIGHFSVGQKSEPEG